MLTLPDYIDQTGDEDVARILNKGRPPEEHITTRTVMSWRLKTRLPRKEHASLIVKRCPVSYEGIYSVERKLDHST